MLDALGVDLKVIIFAIVNFLILAGVLTKFLYKPFIAMLDNRKQSIQDSFDNAALTNRKADEKLDVYNKKLARAEEDGREVIRAARARADEQAQMIIDEANRKADQIIKQAEIQIEREKQIAEIEMKKQIAELSMMAAAKIMEKEIETTGQDRIIDDIIDKAARSEWQN